MRITKDPSGVGSPSTTHNIASAILFVLGIVVALGAYGHGFVGRLAIDAELAKFPIQHDVLQMVYVVWHFVTGSMVVFGAALLWAWSRIRRGDRAPLTLVTFIGALYLLVGVVGIVYRNGDPFMAVFITEGALVLLAGWALRRRSRDETPRSPA